MATGQKPAFPGFVGGLRVFHGTSVCDSAASKPGWSHFKLFPTEAHMENEEALTIGVLWTTRPGLGQGRGQKSKKRKSEEEGEEEERKDKSKL